MSSVHTTPLMEIQPASDNTTSLRKLHTLSQVERHLRVLEAAGEDARQHIFMSVVMAKLPESVIFHVEMQRDNEKWLVADLCKAVLEYIEAKEASASCVSKVQQSKPQVASASNPMNYTHLSADALVSQATRHQPSCFFCREAHFTDECK